MSEINELSEDIPFTNKTVIDDIAVIEKVLNRKIDDVLTILPSWVEKKFIKKLFLINTAFASELKKFRRNRNLYPYSAYINWEPKPAGNILLNDRRFLSIIYRENGAQFHDIEKINKVNVHTVMSVYEYIEQTNGNISPAPPSNSSPNVPPLNKTLPGGDEQTNGGQPFPQTDNTDDLPF